MWWCHSASLDILFVKILQGNKLLLQLYKVWFVFKWIISPNSQNRFKVEAKDSAAGGTKIPKVPEEFISQILTDINNVMRRWFYRWSRSMSTKLASINIVIRLLKPRSRVYRWLQWNLSKSGCWKSFRSGPITYCFVWKSWNYEPQW